MQAKPLQKCLSEIETLGAIAFSKVYYEKNISTDVLQELKNETSGLVNNALEVALQSKSSGKSLTASIPTNKAVHLIDLTEKFNLPGYSPERITREASIALKELNLARALDNKNPQAISENWDILQAAKADIDKEGEVNGIFTASEMQDSILELYSFGLRAGLSTGWTEVDKFYSVRECEFTVVTGIPGSGKSTWLDALAVNLYGNHNWKIAFCSPENWPISRHAVGLIEKVMGKPFCDTPFTARLTKKEIEKGIKIISDAFFFTQLQDEGMSISNILHVMQGVIEKHGVKGIVLDPWNELEHRRPTDKSETEFISESLGQIRRFARFNKVHIWVVAHPTKLKRKEDGTYPVPRLYDISGSAAFYNKADNGICIHRRNPKVPEVDIHIQKIRFKEIGKLGRAKLGFISETGTYFDKEVSEKETQTEAPF